MSTSECFCSSKNQIDMKAEKSLSSRLSRRNISVAGRAAHSVMAFILMVRACSSESFAASNEPQGMSLSMSQRTDSSCLNSSGYSIGVSLEDRQFYAAGDNPTAAGATRLQTGFESTKLWRCISLSCSLAEVGVAAAPVDVGKAEIEVAQRAADGDVRQAQVDAGAIRLVAQPLAHRLHAGVDLAELAVDPGLAALALRPAGPVAPPAAPGWRRPARRRPALPRS